MHALFRHMAVRLWATVLIGGLLSLWLLPRLQGHFGLNWLVVEVAVIFGLCYVLIGYLFRHWAQDRIESLVQDAAGFERDGLTAEALNCYNRGTAILDSYLVSQRTRRKLAEPLARRLARFHFARADEDAIQNFIPAYLSDQPQDAEVAELWVRQTEQRGGFKEAHQDLAARISSAHPDNCDIQRILAGFFMFLERTDYPALAAYRCVWNDRPPPASDFIRQLALLFARDRRVDEWSLEAYLGALKAGVPRSDLIDALAACVHLIPDSPGTRTLMNEARQVLEGMSAADIEALCEDFRPLTPGGASRKAATENIGGLQRLRRLFALLSASASSVASALTGSLKRLGRLFRSSARARRIAAICLMTVAVAAVALFAWSTLRHLTKAPATPPIETAQPSTPEVSDPFTLQVAAYLRLEYAKKFVTELKAQGLDAYWSTAVSGDKKWYQVRISHFATKQAALELGESLKNRGLIDDFYVANYNAGRTE